MAHAPEHWQEEAVQQAKKELVKRNVTQKEQDKILAAWNDQTEAELKEEAERLERNKTVSYPLWEMVILFLFGPFLFFRPYILNTHTLFTLKDDNYLLKFKQRLIIFGLSFVFWICYVGISYHLSEKKRLEEIDKIDISDWKEKHSYD